MKKIMVLMLGVMSWGLNGMGTPIKKIRGDDFTMYFQRGMMFCVKQKGHVTTCFKYDFEGDPVPFEASLNKKRYKQMKKRYKKQRKRFHD